MNSVGRALGYCERGSACSDDFTLTKGEDDVEENLRLKRSASGEWAGRDME